MAEKNILVIHAETTPLVPPLPLLHITSVLWAKGAVVGAVTALLAEVDIGSDATLQQRLGGPGVVAHTQEDLVGLVLAEETQGMHLWRKSGVGKENRLGLRLIHIHIKIVWFNSVWLAEEATTSPKSGC